MKPLVLLSSDTLLLGQLRAAFARQAPELQVVLADDPAAKDAEIAACWFPPVGSLASLPALKLIHSVAAGVDHLDADPERPALPVCRVVDPAHRQGMAEYVRWAVLHYHRDFDRALEQQSRQLWRRHPQVPASVYKVGVMGLGSLGGAIAAELAEAGYAVRGWARTEKPLEGVETFAGEAGFAAFLSGLDLLVNLLPLTEATKGILCTATFNALKPGAAIVNCGRGQHLRGDDLEQALAEGQLRGALLDVFEKEPLPLDNRLWTTPGVIITPHMASAASHDCIARQIAENARRLAEGLPLINLVDPRLGY
ncbi:glyoxylate/hydroxypyruvate reductase A [Pseudomonas cavernicola]|uniref:Glyoxylate/hydroxypyruvate reductase A n=1 Tax=Pseudomonas cavernicola TaxID=2320866 RepID=A0A418X9E7_9PSED|nr:glyoxylate/hydroxypyruvate reductase A [Pseudomonas cavernicola]RJG09091.1 glyoxylate/hydroxypyruvate reductase A [Pseudomonas cavernicola]